MRCQKCGSEGGFGKYCTSCGEELQSGKRCPVCGSPLSHGDVCEYCGYGKGRQKQETEQEEDEPNKKADKKSKFLLLFLVVVILFCIMGIAFVLTSDFTGNQKKQSAFSGQSGISRTALVPSGEEEALTAQTEPARTEPLQTETETKKAETEEKETEEKETEESETEEPETEKNEEALHTYVLQKANCSWTEAMQKCRDMGGYLVRINSREEFDHIVSLIQEEGYEKIQFYIGMRREKGETAYYLTDENNELGGERMDHGKTAWCEDIWLEGEPSYKDEGSGIEETCVSLFRYAETKEWVLNDIPDDLLSVAPAYKDKIGYICEIE